jgi:hypothetical protein
MQIWIRDLFSPGSGIRDPEWKKSDPGSGINIPDPQQCTTVQYMYYTSLVIFNIQNSGTLRPVHTVCFSK